MVDRKDTSRTQRIIESNKNNNMMLFIFLGFMGVGASILSFLVDEACRSIAFLRELVHIEGYDWLVWIAFQVVFVGVARFVVMHTPMAEGSGIPELKAELCGLRLTQYFSPRVLLTKLCGLSLARGVGLPLGKEGPFVHMSACVAENMLRIPAFRNLRENVDIRRTLLFVSVATGTAATFGAPIGGVLFALEAKPDYVFRSISYWSCLFTTVLGAFVYRLFKSVSVGTLTELSPIIRTNMGHFGKTIDKMVEDVWRFIHGSPATEDPVGDSVLFFLYILLGCLCGLLASGFIAAHEFVARQYSAWTLRGGVGGKWLNPDDARSPVLSSVHRDVGRPYVHTYIFNGPRVRSNTAFQIRSLVLCLFVALLNGALTYAIPLLRTPNQGDLIGKLISMDPLVIDDVDNHLFVDFRSLLMLCLVIKCVTTCMCLCLPLPTGCIAPVYVIGAITGRLFGDLASHYLGKDPVALQARFALIGCAAFAAAVCRSFSIVVAVFECVALPAALLPLSASALAAIFTANATGSLSIFDAILQRKQLPSLQLLTSRRRAELPVTTLADTDFTLLDPCPTFKHITEALNTPAQFFPVVYGAKSIRPGESSVTQFVVGSIGRSTLVAISRKMISEGGHPHAMENLCESELVAHGVPTGMMTALVVKPTMSTQDVFFLLDFHHLPCAVVCEHGQIIGTVCISDLLDQRPRNPPVPILVVPAVGPERSVALGPRVRDDDAI